MQGDFSVLNFDPHEHERGVSPPRRRRAAQRQRRAAPAGPRDDATPTSPKASCSSSAGTARPGATSSAPASARCRRRSPTASASSRRSSPAARCTSRVRPGRAWADGILTRLAGDGADPTGAGRARWRPISARRSPTPQPTPDEHRRRRARRGDPRSLRGGAARLPVPAAADRAGARRPRHGRARLRQLPLPPAAPGRRRGLQHDHRPSCATIRRPRAGSPRRSRRSSRSPATARSSAAAATPASSTTSTASRSPTPAGGAGALQVVASGTAGWPGAAASMPTTDPAPRDHRRRPRRDRQLGAHRVLPRGAAIRRAGRHLERRLRHDGHAQHRPRSRARGAGQLRHAAVHHRLRCSSACGTASRTSPPSPMPSNPVELRDGIRLVFDAPARGQLPRPATTGPSRCAPARSPTRRC